MKITYLGTAAAEAIPAVFCKCAVCQKAAEVKGKNIRTRSQSLINDDLLIDFSCDTMFHCLKNDIDLSKIKTVIFTHCHIDHLFAQGLNKYAFSAGQNAAGKDKKLRILCNRACIEIIEKTCHSNLDLFEITPAEPFGKYEMGGYSITAFPAQHDLRNEKALIYLISDGKKNLLYCHDTGKIYPEIYDYLIDNNIYIDFCSLDCTNGTIKWNRNLVNTHMGYESAGYERQQFLDFGICDSNTVFYANHFSHNAADLHEEMEKKAAEYGLLVSYDGLTVTF